MNIKRIIKDFEQVQIDVQIKLDQLKRDFTNEENLWLEFEKMDKAFFLNDKAINFLADSLQQMDMKDHLKLFDLQDVKAIYQLLADFYPDNINYQEDLIAFVYHILDDEAETLLLIDKAEQRVERTLKYFREIRMEIKNS